MNDDARPDPDQLLRRLQDDDARARRGRLKIFFGYAPGVGKTYAMLQAAARDRADGIDVVVGCVETHGRPETQAMLATLPPPLPRREVEHRGVRLDEFDLDAAIVRAPTCLLVDELAHHNAPGSRHTKRWQDVLELLDRGIDVVTTLNVQHVESLNDAVARVTHVVVKETVPDAVLDRADEIELVDLPPDELLERLAAGHVYLGDGAARAAERFFKRGNLLALRELSLRRTAERVDADVRAWRDANDREHGSGGGRSTSASRRLLAVVQDAPSSPRVIRAARRLADEADVPWLVVVVDSPLRAPGEAMRTRRDAWLALAERLGAGVVRLSGVDVAEVVLEAACRDDITQIVVAADASDGSVLQRWRARWRRLVGRELVQQLLDDAGDIEVHVIGRRGNDVDVADAVSDDLLLPELTARGAGGAFALVAAATVLGGGLQFFGAIDVVMLYLAAIMVVAVRFGGAASVLASAASVAAFDFFFVAPTHTFNVADLRHVITFAMMFVVGVFISGIMARLRRQQDDARHREQRTRSLLAMTRATATEDSRDGIAWALAHQVADTMLRPAAVLLPDVDGALHVEAAVGVVDVDGSALAAAQWVARHARPAGRGTDTLPGAPALALPLLGSISSSSSSSAAASSANDEAVAGVVVIFDRPGHEQVIDREHRDLLDAFARQAALVLERVALTEQAKTAAVARRSDEVRASLLSAVSHDLRTPLAGITGAATTLRDSGDRLADDDRAALLDDIASEAFHLERMVESLLDMTRVDSGALVLRRAIVPIDEVVGSALARIEPRLSGRRIDVTLPANDDAVFAAVSVDVDAILFERVLVNVLDNALHHTTDAIAFAIDLVGDDVDSVRFVVRDRGAGFPAGLDPFARFARGEGSRGVGLGLSIARGVVEAHGGSITARNADDGTTGAVVTIILPRATVPA